MADFLFNVLFGSLYLAAFAVLLIGYLWDFFRLKKSTTVLMLGVYCVLGTTADLLVAGRLGYGAAEQAVYILVSCVIPYCFCYFLTRMPLRKYLYCLGSISIQVFFIVGALEYFNISQRLLLELPLYRILLCLALLAVLDTAIICVFRCFAAPLFRDYQCADAWNNLLVSPVSGAAALGFFYFLTDFEESGAATMLIFAACYIALSIADVAAVHSIRISIRATVAEARLESANQILDLQKEQYRRLSASIAQTRQARHDLRHHMSAVSAFLAADDSAGLREYLAQWGQALPAGETQLYTGNYAADIIVGHYLSLARENGIRVDFSLRIPEDCSIRDTDLCVLMGNCLENAIEACMKLPPEQRFLRVESAVKNKYLAVTIANSYGGQAAMQNGAYLSDKRRRESAGVGLESVNAVVRAYHGEMKLDGQNGVFTVYIMLRMLEKEEEQTK